MFSVENLYYILYVNVFKKYSLVPIYFSKFGSTDPKDLVFFPSATTGTFSKNFVFFYDQEPLLSEPKTMIGFTPELSRTNFKILCTSEQSDFVDKFCKENYYYHLYYFFHGFAALDWYSDAKYMPMDDFPIVKPYLCFNRLCSDLRSYRLYLISELIENNLLERGLVSLQFFTDKNLAKQEVFSSNSKLTKPAKKLIAKHLLSKKQSFKIDKETIKGDFSAHFGSEEHYLWHLSLFHIVTETIFYEDKLHLTEKIFKPIVVKRPFILVGAYKNLEYLKSYGFKTFSKWIDESYDNEPDPDKRIQLIVQEIKKISSLSNSELFQLKQDMQEVLDYNFNHFFGQFKEIIVDELLDNIQSCYGRWNNGRLDGKIFLLPDEEKLRIKKLFLQ